MLQLRNSAAHFVTNDRGCSHTTRVSRNTAPSAPASNTAISYTE